LTYGMTFVTNVPQLPRLVRVPPQVPKPTVLGGSG
jgi:hypothetical protein